MLLNLLIATVTQMATLLFQYLAMNNNDNLPNIIGNLPKPGMKFCQILNRPVKIAEVFSNFAKVAKFRQIWSHCSLRTVYLPRCNVY